MGIKSEIAKIWAKRARKAMLKWANNPLSTQEKQLFDILKRSEQTSFGKDHGLKAGMSHQDFSNKVPIRDYEQLRLYVDRVVKGEPDVLWPGKPQYLCKTSGTTSGVKYIPVTSDSMPHHINSTRLVLFNYMVLSGKCSFVNGNMIFLQGSPELKTQNGIKIGRLSGIVANHVPYYLRSNRLPSYKINCISDWEEKIDAIVEETAERNMTLIGGIPPWVQMYFEKLIKRTGKKNIGEVFPNFSIFIYGGVNYLPYKPVFKTLMGKELDSLETYPASEGFIAFQDCLENKGLLLNLNAGIYFEFVPVEEISSETPTRLTLKDVELEKNYAIILTTNAGLYAYNIGDTVKFVSLNPFRIRVTGRIKHFISAFGEHVIGEEVENAMNQAILKLDFSINDFHVAPMVKPESGLPYHEWFIEFSGKVPDIDQLATKLDELMCDKNTYYLDLIKGSVLQPLKISVLQRNAFVECMKLKGKLGGQNKVPRLSNDRKFADLLSQFS